MSWGKVGLGTKGERSSLPTWSWGLVETTGGNSCVESQPSNVSSGEGGGVVLWLKLAPLCSSEFLLPFLHFVPVGIVMHLLNNATEQDSLLGMQRSLTVKTSRHLKSGGDYIRAG